MSELPLEAARQRRRPLGYGTICSRVYYRKDRGSRIYVEVWTRGSTRRWRRSMAMAKDRAQYEWKKIAEFQSLAILDFHRKLKASDFRNNYGLEQ